MPASRARGRTIPSSPRLLRLLAGLRLSLALWVAIAIGLPGVEATGPQLAQVDQLFAHTSTLTSTTTRATGFKAETSQQIVGDVPHDGYVLSLRDGYHNVATLPRSDRHRPGASVLAADPRAPPSLV